MGKLYTQEEVDFLIKNYQKMTIQEIADELGRTYGSVFRKAQDLYLSKNGCINNVWSDNEINFIKENYKEMTNKEMAEHINRTSKSIEVKLSKLGLKRDSIYTYDRNKFNKIETEEDAYWLGFLYADGWVYEGSTSHSIGIELQYSDINHLKKFNKYMNGNMHIDTKYSKSPSSDNVSKICRICFFSKNIFYNLIKCGCIPKKSHKIEMPYSCVPDGLMRHFIRGYFDGDGSIGIYHHSQRKKLKYPRAKITCGSKNFVNQLRDYLITKNIHCGIHESQNGIYDIFFTGKDNVISFAKYMYDDSNIYLDRKYEIYKKCLLLQ